MNGFRRMEGKVFALLLVCMGLLLFVYKVGDRDLWAPDEDEYAQISREMIRSGNWLYPTCNGEPWTIKPALYNWLVGLISLPYGDVNEFRARIFSALGALGTFLLTFYLGKRAFSPRAGLLSALVLGTSALFLEHGRWAQTYMLSTFFATLAIFLFHRGYTEPGKRTGSYLLMYVAVGLGVLTMGPVNFVIPGLVVLVYLVVVKDLKHIGRMKPIWGVLITAAITLPWYVVAGLRDDYGSELVVRTNLTRFFNTWTHNKPIYYYVTGIPWAFLPWSLFLPGAFHLAASRVGEKDRQALKFVLVWVLSLLLFFSLAQCKRHQYLLAAYPALALLVGCLGDRAIRDWPRTYFRRAVIIPSLVLAGMLAVMTVAMPVAAGIFFRPFLALSIGASVITGTFAALLLAAWRKDRPAALLFLPAAFMTAFLVFGVHVLIPSLNVFKSPRPFCNEIVTRLDQGGDWAMFKFYRAAYVYYTDSFAKVINTERELKAFMARPTFSMAAMVAPEHAKLEDPELAALPIIVRGQVGHRKVVLIANRDAP